MSSIRICTKYNNTMNENIQLNDHKQNCDSASAKGKPACIMPSDSNFAASKAEYPPMHNGEFNISQTF